ncbi:MAG: LLM class flavin-dependent oxidoreductase [Alphaproteobacteria bacterium]|nr:LLM class flavin-dependent oxidoreductase [Alphaproteobacteria bacterium]
MALKDKVAFGISLPHRSPDPIDMAAVKQVAQRAEALGFRDLWVTENTLNEESMCFDPVVVLTYAAAVTSKIRVGASVVVLAVHHPAMVAHQWATLDYVSGGRAILGVGLGRGHHYRQFEVPEEGKVARFREEVALIRALWNEERVTFRGKFYNIENEVMSPRPVQQPMPLWMGVGHPNAIRRTAELADGWMGSGGSSIAEFGRSVPILTEALAARGRDPQDFPISKRIFLAVDDNPAAARRELARWFDEVYHNPPGTDASGIHGTPEQVRERLEEVVAMGANHIMLNPVSNFVEQAEALAEVTGLK